MAHHALPVTTCGRATPTTALWPFQGLSAGRAVGLWPYSTQLDTPRRTPMQVDDLDDFDPRAGKVIDATSNQDGIDSPQTTPKDASDAADAADVQSTVARNLLILG
jgi:hypothetical protein